MVLVTDLKPTFSVKVESGTQAIGLHPIMQNAIAFRMVTGTQLAASLVDILHVSDFTEHAAKLVVETCFALIKKKIDVPATPTAMVQTLMARVDGGDMVRRDVNAVATLLDVLDTSSIPTTAAIIDTLRPQLIARAKRSAIDSITNEIGNGNDVDVRAAFAIVERAERAGDTATIGCDLSVKSLDNISAHGRFERVSCGVAELDALLEGGKPAGTLLVWMADYGGGKSMALGQEAVAAAICGLIVVYITVELPAHIVEARLFAALTGVPINTFLQNPDDPDLRELVRRATEGNDFGNIHVKHMDPKRADPTSIFAYIEEYEKRIGRKIDMLSIDYADKLVANAHVSSRSKRDSSYQEQGDVYDQLFTWAANSGRRCSTASQSGRRPDGGRKKHILTGHNAADSMGKARTSDIFITINKDDEENLIKFLLDKYRLGEGGKLTDSVPCDFACSRVAPFDLAESYMARQPKRRMRRAISELDVDMHVIIPGLED